MVRVSRTKVRATLAAARAATDANAKGELLEDLIGYVFSKVPGLTLRAQNGEGAFRAEEIDLGFWNNRHSLGFAFLENVVLVECKNWSRPAGSAEISWFDTKIRIRGLSFGIFVSMEGITGDATENTAAHEVIARALAEGRRLVVIDAAELADIADTKDLAELIKTKIVELSIRAA